MTEAEKRACREAGERLRSEIKRLGMTQEKFAEKAGMSHRTLTSYTTGASDMSRKNLAKMKVLKVNIDYVVDGSTHAPVDADPELARAHEALERGWRALQ